MYNSVVADSKHQPVNSEYGLLCRLIVILVQLNIYGPRSDKRGLMS